MEVKISRPQQAELNQKIEVPAGKAAPAYTVFNWRAQFEQKVEHWTFHQTLRLDNLLDRQYVGSVIVGDGNFRYYEAAPGRSWYAGAGAQYTF